jgi:hypothetical protein
LFFMKPKKGAAMATVDSRSRDWVYLEDDPLVGRLRRLQWAEVSPEIRERCWEKISARISEMQPREASSDGRVRAIGDRYAFSRRQTPCRVAVAQAWAARGRRPAISLC